MALIYEDSEREDAASTMIPLLKTLTLSLCLLWSSLVWAEEPLQVRTISISPYGMGTDEAVQGIYFDLANVLLKESGYSNTNHLYPYARIMSELKSGQTDLTIMFKYRELQNSVVYVSPLPPLQTIVIGLEGINFDSLDSLVGKKLAYLRGAKFSDDIDQNPDIIKVETKDFQLGIKMLLRGRVDAIIGPIDPILSAALLEQGDKTIRFGCPLVVDERTPWVQISRKSLERIDVDKLRATYERLIKRGELTRLRVKYLGEQALESNITASDTTLP